MITALDKLSRMLGLKINLPKNKVMINSLGRAERLEIGGNTVKVVGEYTYYK